jgi:hypothetical protein
MDPRAGTEGVEMRKILTPPGLQLRLLGRPVRSQSLYRLSYFGYRHLRKSTGNDWMPSGSRCQELRRQKTITESVHRVAFWTTNAWDSTVWSSPLPCIEVHDAVPWNIDLRRFHLCKSQWWQDTNSGVSYPSIIVSRTWKRHVKRLRYLWNLRNFLVFPVMDFTSCNNAFFIFYYATV